MLHESKYASRYCTDMFDEPIRKIMRRGKLLKASPQTHVAKAAKLMAARNAGAIAVIQDDQLVGIFTERDVVFRVIACGLDPAATLISAVMTPDPQTVDPGKPFGYALFVMHREGFRHLPVVEDGRVVGMVSARSAMDPDLQEFASEINRLKYYGTMR
jgi:CBS domain-containing protein